MLQLLLGLIGLALLALGGLVLFTWTVRRRVIAALLPLGRFVTVDGQRIHHLDQGAGPPVLLIHGLGGQIRNFTYALVERLVADHRVIVIDRPGSGWSTRAPGAGATVRAQAAQIAAFLEVLGLDRPPLVVGHSLGGAIALALALDHPDKVAGLALVAPLTHHQADTPDAFKGLTLAPALRPLVAWTLNVPMAIRNSPRVMATLFGPEEPVVDFPLRAGGLNGLRPEAYLAAATDLDAAGADMRDLPARYGRLAVPVGVLFGAGDRVLDPARNSRPLDGVIPGLDLEIVPGGHMLPVTQPDLTAAFIRRISRRAFAPKPEPV